MTVEFGFSMILCLINELILILCCLVTFIGLSRLFFTIFFSGSWSLLVCSHRLSIISRLMICNSRILILRLGFGLMLISYELLFGNSYSSIFSFLTLDLILYAIQSHSLGSLHQLSLFQQREPKKIKKTQQLQSYNWLRNQLASCLLYYCYSLEELQYSSYRANK